MTVVENLQNIFSEAPSSAITSGQRRKLPGRAPAARGTVITLAAAGAAVLGFLTGRLWIPAAAEFPAAGGSSASGNPPDDKSIAG